jgi:hypothetical protein
MDIGSAVKSLKEERASIAAGIANTEAHLKNLQKRLTAIDSAITALEPLCNEPLNSEVIMRLMDEAENAPGITDSVRAIFRSNREHYLTPTQVRDALKTHGLMKGYDNEMAVIHQVISRLKEKGQISAHATEKAYRWNPRNAVAILGGPVHENSLASKIANQMMDQKRKK